MTQRVGVIGVQSPALFQLLDECGPRLQQTFTL